MTTSFDGRQPSPWRLRQVIKRGLALAVPRKMLLVRANESTGGVGLTFDDGPHPEFTPRVLDVLGECGIRSTFFVVGSAAERYPHLVRRIVEEGHSVGHHTYTHSDPVSTSAGQLVSELRQTERLLRSITGRGSKIFRPPHGKMTAAKFAAVWCCGFSVILWNQDSKDYARQSAIELSRWVSDRPLHAGDIVLMHDTNLMTPAVLKPLIESVRGRGLRFATIPELQSPAAKSV